MDRTEVELVPWLVDRIRGLKGEELRRRLMGKGFESPNYQTTPGSYLVEMGHIETLYQLVGWVGDHFDPWVKVRRVGETYVFQVRPDRFLKIPCRYLQMGCNVNQKESERDAARWRYTQRPGYFVVYKDDSTVAVGIEPKIPPLTHWRDHRKFHPGLTNCVQGRGRSLAEAIDNALQAEGV